VGREREVGIRLGGLARIGRRGRMRFGHGDCSLNRVTVFTQARAVTLPWPTLSIVPGGRSVVKVYREVLQPKRREGKNRRKPIVFHYLPPSSSGLGHSPLTAKTGVRVPLGVIGCFVRICTRLTTIVCNYSSTAVRRGDRRSLLRSWLRGRFGALGRFRPLLTYPAAARSGILSGVETCAVNPTSSPAPGAEPACQ